MLIATLWAALAAGASHAFTAPQAAVDRDGNATFVWQSFLENRVPTAALDQARWRSVTGTLVPRGGDPGDEITIESRLENRPKVAVDLNGTATIVWAVVDDAGRYLLKARRRTVAGALTPTRTLTAAANDGLTTQINRAVEGDDPLKGQVAVDQNGKATFIWRRFDGAKWVVVARQMDSGGQLGPLLTLSRAGQNSDNPQLAVGQLGTVVAVWRREDGATRSRYITQTRRIPPDPQQQPLGPTLDLSAAGEHSFEPQVVVTPRGHETFVWSRSDGSDARVQTRRRRSDGTLGPVITLSDPGRAARNPQVATDASGNEVFVWRRRTSDELQSFMVQGKRRKGSGEVDTVPTNISDTSPDTDDPQLAADNAGNTTVVWQWHDGTRTVVQARGWAAAGGLDSVFPVSVAGRRAAVPQVEMDRTSATAAGTATLVWECDGSIHTRRRAPDGSYTVITLLAGSADTLTSP